MNVLTNRTYHMGASGIFELCGCSAILLQHFLHVLCFIIWETKETYSSSMERLQFVTHLHNRNKCFLFQVGSHSVNIVTEQLLPAYKLIHQLKLFLHKTASCEKIITTNVWTFLQWNYVCWGFRSTQDKLVFQYSLQDLGFIVFTRHSCSKFIIFIEVTIQALKTNNLFRYFISDLAFLSDWF
jgi:hypothetical protein